MPEETIPLEKVQGVEMVGDLEEAGEALFRGEEEREFVSPHPGTFLLLMKQNPGRLGELLNTKGQEAISCVMLDIQDKKQLLLMVVTLDAAKFAELKYHPLFRLRETPTLMNVTGSHQLSGVDVTDRNLIRYLMSTTDEVIKDPLKLYLKYGGKSKTLDQLLVPASKEDTFNLPPEIRFWWAKEAAKKQAEVEVELKDYRVKTKLDTKILEARLRNEFRLPEDQDPMGLPPPPEEPDKKPEKKPAKGKKNKKGKGAKKGKGKKDKGRKGKKDKGKKEKGGTPPIEPEKPPEEEEPVEKEGEDKLIPVNLETLYTLREEMEIERMMPLPPPPPKAPPKPKKGKDKKGKKGKDKKGKKGKK